MAQSPSSSSNSLRNIKEKNRRNHMKDLIGKLASLISPPHSKLAAPEIVDQATSYITQLQKNQENLKRRRDLLRGDDQETAAASSSRTMLPIINITTLDSILQVNLICGLNRNFMLHEIMSVLQEEGAEVVGATQLNGVDKVIYIIRSQALIPRIGIDVSRVEERVKQLIQRKG